ncbi:hypothetical protein ACFVUS_33645 [Nocardia sp. NPDC058058]|uniref:hypothetical protein n=1 Tax=Nocardia sp. NPDC058058 TaxID=3346317 RepID=UPI0036DD8346
MLFMVLEDGTEAITFPRLNWAVVVIASALAVGLAVVIAIVVGSAHFEQTPAPEPPASCEPFCPMPT